MPNIFHTKTMASSKLHLLLLTLSCLTFSSFADTASFLECLSTNQLKNIVYTPSNANFSSTLRDYIRNSRFNTSTASTPSVIITPLTESQVQSTVTCAVKSGTHLKIRSGGHDYEGLSYTSSNLSTPFAILDTFRLSSIDIDLPSETAWVQAGATLGELYYNIWNTSKVHAFPAGVCPTIGAGGHISGGGYGNMLRKHGLSVDNLLDARIVDVRGRVLDRKGMGEDVFWAIRGGGGASFGVIVAYKLKLVRVPPVVTVFQVTRTLAENATDLVYRWQFVADKLDRDLFVRAYIQPEAANKTAKVSFIALYLGGADALVPLVKSSFPELGLTKKDCKETSWVKSVLFWALYPDGTPETALLDRTTSSPSAFKMKSDYVKEPIPREGLQGLLEKVARSGEVGVMFNPYGGRMSEIPSTATAFPHRAGNIYKIQYLLNWAEAGPSVDKAKVEEQRDFFAYLTPFVSKNPREAFLNYRDNDIGTTDNGPNTFNEGRVYGTKYFKENYDRLVQVKTRFDPGNFFRYEQSIPPLNTRYGKNV